MLAHPNLVRPTPMPGEPSFYRKELHIFDRDVRMAKGKDFWLSHHPKCTTQERLVATDMTPYMLLRRTPNNIKQYYGEQLGRVKFALILRNPVKRIQSAFHFIQKKGWCEQKYLDNGFN